MEDALDLSTLSKAEAKAVALRLWDMRRAEAGMRKAYTLIKGVERHPFTDALEHVERMAFQGMNGEQIAARLGVSARVLRDAAQHFPDLMAALTGGRARATDELSAVAMRAAIGKGDIGAVKFMLQTRHGYNPPKDGPSVVVNMGAGATPPALEIADEQAARQQRLLETDPI
jgi:hypothetical protein